MHAAAALLITGAVSTAAMPAEKASHRRTESQAELSLEQAIVMARKRSPDVAIGAGMVRQAEATRVGAGIIMPTNPRLSADIRPPLPKENWSVGYSASLETLFDVGGAPGARVREANRRAEAARADLAVTTFYAGLQAWRLYLAAAISQERLQETKEALVIGERVLSASRERLGAGAASEIEEAQASMDVAQLNASIESIARQREIQLMELRRVLDLPAQTKLVLTTRPLDPPAPPPLAALVDRAYQSRPELAARRARMQLLEATKARLAKEAFPKVGFFVGYDNSPGPAAYLFGGASIELPVAQRNQGPRAVAAREMETEQARLEVEVRQIERDVHTAWAAYEARRGELKILAERAIPAAQRNMDLVETGWRAGRFDIFRVATAARDLVRVRATRLDVLEATWAERIGLEQAAGLGAKPVQDTSASSSGATGG